MAEMILAMPSTQKTEVDDDDFGTFSMSFSCTTTAAAFLDIDSSPQEPVTHRRQSVTSSATSSGTDFVSSTSGSSASPSTPLSAEYMNIVPSRDSTICVPDDFNLPDMYGGWKSAGQGVDLTWMTEEPKYHNSSPFLDYSSMDTLGVQDIFTNSSNSNDWHMLSTSAANLSFSRSILDEHQLSSDGFPPEAMGQWIPTMVHTPPQTIAPSATFQPTLALSPCKLEPMTPLRYA